MREQLSNFLETLEDYGETYFTIGNVEQDYNNIKGILKAQGYFSGCSYRFYFNDKLELERVESRF